VTTADLQITVIQAKTKDSDAKTQCISVEITDKANARKKNYQVQSLGQNFKAKYPYFWRYSNFVKTLGQDKLGEGCKCKRKTSLICSAVLMQYRRVRLVTEREDHSEYCASIASREKSAFSFTL